MEKNKSIDGLVTRRSKKSTPLSKPTKTSKKTPTSKKRVTKKPVQPPKETIEPELTEVKTEETITDQPNEIIVTEDFLSPVQAFDFDSESGELKATEQSTEENSNKPGKKPKKIKKKPSKMRKIITSIILIIILAIIGLITWAVFWGNDIIAKITGGQGNLLDLLTFVEETYEPLRTDANGRTNILAFGTSGYNMNGDEGNGTHDGAQLTDSIMVISLNQDTGDVAMLSLPRDLKVSSTCTATGKINEIYWCNGGSGDASTETEAEAAKALMAEVGSILGIDFQYYAHLNWGSLVSIVDTLGGINVTLDEGIYDYYFTKAVFEPGIEYTINGEEALGLARARHGTTGGDFSRGASQQKILIGIKDKIFEKDLSITDTISLASTLGDNLRTNFSLEEMKTLAHLTYNFDFNNIRQISLLEPERLMTTGNINEISYVLPVGGAGYYTRIQEYIAKMFSNDPRTYEDSSILVLNGTETPGLASTEKISLEEAGYKNISVDDAPDGEYLSQYSLYIVSNSAPNTKKMLEEKYQLQAKSADELPESISRDYDFILILGNENES